MLNTHPFKHILVVLVVVILILAGFFAFSRAPDSKKSQLSGGDPTSGQEYSQSVIEIGSRTVQVDLATTPAQQALGLSGRTSLEKDHGMLFVFGISAQYGFWMKDMLFSIDIIWINEAKSIVHIEKSVSPDSYPKSFTTEVPAKYVLEVPAGFSDQTGSKVGDKVEF